MRSYLLSLGPTFLIGWLVALSLVVVGYLLRLQVQELRRNRRMDAERERLGLKPGPGGKAHRPFRPKLAPDLRTAWSGINGRTAPAQSWTVASTRAGYREVTACITGTSTVSEASKMRARYGSSYVIALLHGIKPRSPMRRQFHGLDFGESATPQGR
jgi:hypothetical protein